MTTHANVLRAYSGPDAVAIRSQEGAPDTMTGHFAVWNTWTEINSRFEGHFMERIAPGAFDDSLQSGTPKVLFEHGKDPQIGNKPIGTATVVEADGTGMRFDVELFDAPYVNDIKPALRSGQMGSSFRAGYVTDGYAIDRPMRSTSWNPDRLPELTQTNMKLREFGPVTFPAYAGATAGMRSLTDDFFDEWMRDTGFVARLTDRVGLTVVEQILAEAGDAPNAEPERAAVDHAEAAHAIVRRHWLAEHNLCTERHQ